MVKLIDKLIDIIKQLEKMAGKVKGGNDFLKENAKKTRNYSVADYFIERHNEVTEKEEEDWDIQAEQIKNIIDRIEET